MENMKFALFDQSKFALFDQSTTVLYEPHHEKTCLRGSQPGKNRPAQLQRLSRSLKFRI